MEKPWDGLTPKQKKFVEKYHEMGNATRAYIAAGYIARGNGAEANAARTLRNDKVLGYLQYLQGKALEKHEITVESILKELSKVAFADANDALEMADSGSINVKQGVDFNDMEGISFSSSESFSEKGTSKSTSISIQRSNKVKALQELARLHGYYERKQGDDKGTLESISERAIKTIRELSGKK